MTTPNPTNLALEAAVALWRAPSLARVMRERALPEGVSLLLSILARRQPAIGIGTAATGFGEGHLHAVVEAYVFQVMLYRGASPRRVLAVAEGMDRAAIRLHLRDLLEWLHPDKATEPWSAPFAARVIDAWRRLEQGDTPAVQAPARVSGRHGRLPWIASHTPLPRQSRRRAGPRLRALSAVFVVGSVLAPGAAEGNAGPRAGMIAAASQVLENPAACCVLP